MAQAVAADSLPQLPLRFGLSHIVLVGDRGMLTQPQIQKLREHPAYSGHRERRFR